MRYSSSFGELTQDTLCPSVIVIHRVKEPEENGEGSYLMPISFQLYLISDVLWPHLGSLRFCLLDGNWAALEKSWDPSFFRVLSCQEFLVFLCEVIIWLEEGYLTHHLVWDVPFLSWHNNARFSWEILSPFSLCRVVRGLHNLCRFPTDAAPLSTKSHHLSLLC